MIESPAAEALREQLVQVEEQLTRLLTSGWRQARGEAASLRQDAEALADAGLPELARRIAAVADAQDAIQALRAIALATSACRQLRLRLPVQGAPTGWAPLAPGKSSARGRTQTVVPISRLLLDGREVWVCTRPTRNDMLLIDAPFPAEEPASSNAGASDGQSGQLGRFFGRLRQQIGKVLDGDSPAEPSHWLRHRLAGTLRWQAQYPLGAEADVGSFRLEEPAWVTEQDDQNSLLKFQRLISAGKLTDGAALFWTSGGFRVKRLERDDPASYVWLDPSATEVLRQAPTERVWGIVWLAGAAIVPVALLAPGERERPPRLTHLIPGAPEDVLVSVA